MSKPLLLEVNAFAKLLSFFYDQKAKGNGDNVMKKIVANSDNEAAKKAYLAWKKSEEDLLLATRDMLIKSGLDTSKIDALLKKYHGYY